MKNNNSSIFTQDLISQWKKHYEKQDIKKIMYRCEYDDVLKSYFLKYLPKDQPILEAGCGFGQWVIYLNRLGYSVIGIEIVSECIEICKKFYPQAPIFVGDVRHLPFPDNYFGGYISLGVIEHMIEGPEKIIDEMIRVLKNDGIGIIMVPSYNYLLRMLMPLRDSFVRIVKYNNVIRKIFNKPHIELDKKLIYDKLRKIQQNLRKEFYPVIGVDPKNGPIFVEYKYPKGLLEKILSKYSLKIIEKNTIFSPCCLESLFGKLFCKSNTEFNILGIFLQNLLNFINPHILNSHYICIVKVKK